VRAVGFVVVVMFAVATAHGDPARDWHFGANLRTDFGARFYRVDAGVRLCRIDLIAVLDPWGLENGDYDFDAIASYNVHGHWSTWFGWRETIVPIGRDRQYSEKVLLGVEGLMPSLGTDRLKLYSGLELAIHAHSHGGGIQDTWVCVDSPTCRKDHFVFGLFGRLEFASAF
jgi:hypothetical protein